jgi:hypothetical protein
LLGQMKCKRSQQGKISSTLSTQSRQDLEKQTVINTYLIIMPNLTSETSPPRFFARFVFGFGF